MTNRLREAALVARYGSATKELTDLVMAAEKAHKHRGKRSLFGRDKGAEADELLSAAVLRTVSKLAAIGMIASDDLHDQVSAVRTAMGHTQAAYPNWPNAYKYLNAWLDEFVKPVDLSPLVAQWMEEARLRRERPKQESTLKFWIFCAAALLAIKAAEVIGREGWNPPVAEVPTSVSTQQTSQRSVAGPYGGADMPASTEDSSGALRVHYGAIFATHPDATQVFESPEFQEWLRRTPEPWRNQYRTALNSGTTSEVIAVFSAYKQAR